MLAKLDAYDYIVLPGVIRINISSSSDPILVDILSEIEKADGRIYVEGEYYSYLSYGIHTDVQGSYIDLQVVSLETA